MSEDTVFTVQNLNRSLAGLGIDRAADLFGMLKVAYTEPQRHYHTIGHIADCLRQFDGVRALAARPSEVEVAIWFHDVVYDPRRADSEERSAAWARSYLVGRGVAESTVARIAGHILATKHHETTDPDTALLLDIDLSILGAPKEVFEAFDASIRREYEWVPDATYRNRRAQLLDVFLARPYIYKTREFRSRYELQARLNMTRKVQALNAATNPGAAF